MTWLLFRPFAPIGIDAHHDGLMLKAAMDVAAGQVLFRDTFTQYGALTTYVHAGWLTLVGPSLLALRTLTVGLYAIAALLLVVVWRRILPPALVTLAFGLWLVMAPFYAPGQWLLPWSSVVALVFQSLSLLCFARAVTAPPAASAIVLSGAAAALTQWSRTPVGAAHTAALCAAWVYLGFARRDRTLAARGLGLTIAGALIVHAVFVGILLRNGTVGDWYDQTVAGPAGSARMVASMMEDSDPARGGGGLKMLLLTLFPLTSPYFRPQAGRVPLLALLALAVGPALLFGLGRRTASRRATAAGAVGQALVVGLLVWREPLLVRSVHGFVLLLPALVLGLVCWGLARAVRGAPEDDGRDVLAVALGFAGLASWLQYYPIDCRTHTFWANSPAIGCAVFALWRLAGRRTAPVALVLGILVLPFLAAQARDAQLNLGTPLATVTGVPVLEGMRAAPPLVEDLERAYALVAVWGRLTRPTPMLIEGGDALLGTFAADLRNPSPYFLRWMPRRPNAESPGERGRFVQEHHPLILVQPRGILEDFFSRLYGGYSILVDVPQLDSVILRPGKP